MDLNTLKPSITEMSDEELMRSLTAVRANRRKRDELPDMQKPSAKVKIAAKSKVSKASKKDLLAALELLKEM